jgi:hypothetical protein
VSDDDRDEPIIAPYDAAHDNEEIAATKIEPLMQQIVEVCRRHGIPFVATLEFQFMRRMLWVCMAQNYTGSVRRIAEHAISLGTVVADDDTSNDPDSLN